MNEPRNLSGKRVALIARGLGSVLLIAAGAGVASDLRNTSGAITPLEVIFGIVAACCWLCVLLQWWPGGQSANRTRRVATRAVRVVVVVAIICSGGLGAYLVIRNRTDLGAGMGLIFAVWAILAGAGAGLLRASGRETQHAG